MRSIEERLAPSSRTHRRCLQAPLVLSSLLARKDQEGVGSDGMKSLRAFALLGASLVFSKFEYDRKWNPTFVEGPFQLPVSSIRAYIKEPITPRFVHVGSAGVTRVERPELDLSKQPPAVCMNKELGYILTFKLKGEDLIHESGIPYTIVRPCALIKEPARADMIFERGDNITGKISREVVDLICVPTLESANACDKIFEVKSVILFSEPFTVDPENPPPEKDNDKYFNTLKGDITGHHAAAGLFCVVVVVGFALAT